MLRTLGGRLLTCLVACIVTQRATGQTAWISFEDSRSSSICGIVNAVNTATGAPIQLVVLGATSELMIVSGTDTILEGTLVDALDNVTDFGAPRGALLFQTDGDGFRTLWWVALDGTVVEVDPFNGAVTAGVDVPSDFLNVPCDACNFVDFPPAGECDDGGGDGGIVIPPIVINLCGMDGAALMASVSGLGGLGLIRRRW